MAFQENSAEQIISNSLLHPWKWDFEYKYNPDFDLGMGDLISDGDIDYLVFSKENEPTSERERGAVTSAKCQCFSFSLKLSKKKSAI